MPKAKSKSKRQLKNSINFKSPYFLFIVSAFVVAGGIAIYKSYAATGTVTFYLKGNAFRYVPLNGLEYTNHWYFNCSTTGGSTPDYGGPPGQYRADIFLDGRPYWEKVANIGTALAGNVAARNYNAGVYNLSSAGIYCTVYWSVK